MATQLSQFISSLARTIQMLKKTFYFLLFFIPSITKAYSEVSFGKTLPEYIKNFYFWSIGIGVGLVIIVLIFSGYKMVTSAGNEQTTGEAKEMIVGAISGFLLLAAAYLIMKSLSLL